MEPFVAFFQKIAAFFTGIATLIASLFGFGGGVISDPSLEARYSGTGDYKAVCYKFPSEDEKIGMFTVWCPDGESGCPAVIILNATGNKASWSGEYNSRFATFGIVSVGTEDTDTGTGYSTQRALEFLLAQNADPDSVLYGKVNTDKLGIVGHSQGGAGALRTVSLLPCADSFCAAAAISPSHEARAESRGWTYDPTQIDIPVFLVSGTVEEDDGLVTSLGYLTQTFDRLAGPKALARKKGVGHDAAYKQSAGYILAWFCWQLLGDTEAANAFTGDMPELAEDPEWQDVILQL